MWNIYMLLIDFAIKRFKSISTVYDSWVSLNLDPFKCFFSLDNQHTPFFYILDSLEKKLGRF